MIPISDFHRLLAKILFHTNNNGRISKHSAGERRRIFWLILIMSVVVLGVTSLTLGVLYVTALEQEQLRLIETARSQARLLEAVARFDSQYFGKTHTKEETFAATLAQMRDAHEHFQGTSETGEFVLGKREDDQIVFLLRHRQDDLVTVEPVPFSATNAEPMRRALSGQSGVMIGPDYDGEWVLAAYEPLTELGLGIVAKIDFAEIQAPFIRVGLLAMGSALVFIFLGTVLFLRISNPLLRQIEASEQKYRGLFDNALNGFALHQIVTDAQGQPVDYIFLEANKSFENQTGLQASEIIGKRVTEVLPGIEESPFISLYGEVALTGVPTRFDNYAPPLDKHYDIAAFSPERGLFATIFSDVTEQKKLIAELEARNTEMERFTYTVSHDLKSPLITIQGFLGLLEKDALAGDVERLQSDISHIFGAAEKMQQLLEELLELSRVGRLVNPPEPVSLTKLAQEAVELVAGQITKSGAEVVISPDLPVVMGDQPRLLEMMQNLVDNAAKFMDSQVAPRIEIGVRQDGDETVCYVQDNGAGIDPRYHEKIFGLFERLDQKTAGTGIGLALVKRIVEVHGGHIWVESEGLGQGSTFCFTLGTALTKQKGNTP